jgi:hypothetical protein
MFATQLHALLVEMPEKQGHRTTTETIKQATQGQRPQYVFVV